MYTLWYILLCFTLFVSVHRTWFSLHATAVLYIHFWSNNLRKNLNKLHCAKGYWLPISLFKFFLKLLDQQCWRFSKGYLNNFSTELSSQIFDCYPRNFYSRSKDWQRSQYLPLNLTCDLVKVCSSVLSRYRCWQMSRERRDPTQWITSASVQRPGQVKRWSSLENSI